MGWTIVRKKKDETTLDLLRSLIDGENDKGAWRIIAGASVRGAAYTAIDHLNKKTGIRKVTAGIFVIEHYPRAKNGFNFAYKELAEEMGPYHCQCPDRILYLLSPTDNERALHWRAACREYNAWCQDRHAALKQIPIGATLKFPKALSLGPHGATDTLRLEHLGKRLFAVPDKDVVVRLHFDRLLKGDFEVIPPAASKQPSLAVG